jgi:hypothetical protein
MTDIKKYVSNGSKILTDEYVEMMWGQFEKSSYQSDNLIPDPAKTNRHNTCNREATEIKNLSHLSIITPLDIDKIYM